MNNDSDVPADQACDVILSSIAAHLMASSISVLQNRKRRHRQTITAPYQNKLKVAGIIACQAGWLIRIIFAVNAPSGIINVCAPSRVALCA